eukprot:gene7065-8769_t
MGTVFAAEFLCLFMALDLTLVSRASVIFYSMPVWMGLLGHFFLPGERLNGIRALGLLLAFLGTAWAIFSRPEGAGAASLAGDLFALGGAWGWAGTAFLARTTSLRVAGPEAQLFWVPEHWLWLIFQSSVVVAGGFVAWLWLLSVYPTTTVASFSFLTPLFAILLGYMLYGEPLTLALAVAFLLVASGIILINRRT